MNLPFHRDGDPTESSGHPDPGSAFAAPEPRRDLGVAQVVERLGHQIGRHLRAPRPPVEERENGVDMAIEHLAEQGRLVHRSDDQLCVPACVECSPSIATSYAVSRSNCYGTSAGGRTASDGATRRTRPISRNR